MESIIYNNIKPQIIKGKLVNIFYYDGIIWEYPNTTKQENRPIEEIICDTISLVDDISLDTYTYYITKSKKNEELFSLIQEFSNVIYVWRPNFDDLFFPLLKDYKLNLEILNQINHAIKNHDNNFDLPNLISAYSFSEEYEGSYWFLKRGFKCDGPYGAIPAYVLYSLIYHIMLKEEDKYVIKRQNPCNDGSLRVVKAFEDFISVFVSKIMTYKEWLDKHRPKREFNPNIPPYIKIP